MKQPRTSDFDPSARPLQRDLKSSMADFPPIERPKPLTLTAPPSTEQVVSDPGHPGREDREGLAVGLTPAVEPMSATGPTGKRKMKPRHAFDIFEDQFETLQQLALEERMRGGPGSQSAMVRQAIDEYIAKIRT
jgi:hypothetical protein